MNKEEDIRQWEYQLYEKFNGTKGNGRMFDEFIRELWFKPLQ